jgi:opacity protein-like surface antigen
MKYTALVAAATIGLAAANSSAPAQEEEESMVPSSFVSYGISAGATVPAGSLSNLHDTGWNVLGLVDWTSRTIPVGFRGDFEYHRLAGAQLTVAPPGGGTSVSTTADDLSLWAATGDLLWLMRRGAEREPITPYAMAGVGLYHTSGDQTAIVGTTETTVSNSSTNFGLNVGAGVMWRISSFSTFAELRFHNVFNGALDDHGDKTNARFFPLSLGLRFGGR